MRRQRNEGTNPISETAVEAFATGACGCATTEGNEANLSGSAALGAEKEGNEPNSGRARVPKFATRFRLRNHRDWRKRSQFSGTGRPSLPKFDVCRILVDFSVGREGRRPAAR